MVVVFYVFLCPRGALWKVREGWGTEGGERRSGWS